MRAALDRWMRGRLVLDLWILRWPRISAETKKRPERSHTADPVRGSVGRLAQDVSCLRASWPPPSPPATFSPPSTPHLSLSAPPPPLLAVRGGSPPLLRGRRTRGDRLRVCPPSPAASARRDRADWRRGNSRSHRRQAPVSPALCAAVCPFASQFNGVTLLRCNPPGRATRVAPKRWGPLSENVPHTKRSSSHPRAN